MMNKTTLILLTCAFMAWIAPASAQSPLGAKNCQFDYFQQSTLVRCIEDGDTSYMRSSFQAMWPITLNGKECSKLQKELSKSITGKDDIHQLDQVVNYLLYTDAEGVSFDSMNQCRLIADDNTVDGWRMDIINSELDLKSLSDRFATFHMFDYAYFAGAAHGLEADTYLTFDLNLNKVVTFEDVVADPEALRPAILQSIKEAYNNTLEVTLSEDGLPPLSSNFYFGNGALHIVYLPYEICGYAQGIIDVTVYPYLLGDEINLSALTPYGIILMKDSSNYK